MNEAVHIQERKSVKAIPIMIALVMSSFMGKISETALNMAMNDLIKAFGIVASTAQWLTTGYLLVLGIVIPISGMLMKRFTTRQLFSASLSFSILGLLIAALAPKFSILLIGRIIQAIGTGIIIPLLYNIVLILFPPHIRGTAMGTVGLVLMFAPATGPIISGFIIDYFDWQKIFWILLPFMIFAFIFGLIYIQNLTKTSKPKVDYWSIILSTLGFGGIVFGFSFSGNEQGGWTSPFVLGPLIIGLIALITFLRRQFVIPEPILHLEVFKRPMFAIAIVITLCANIIIFSTNILLPLYMQSGLGLTAATAGLLLLPGGILNGIMSFVNGRIFDRHGPRALVIIGFSMSTVSALVFSKLSTTTKPVIIIIFFLLLMVSMSMVTSPSQTNGINQLDHRLYPDGAAIVNSMIQTSGAIGTALAMSILNMTQNRMQETLQVESSIDSLIAGVQNAFTFAIFISIIGFICSLFVRRVIVK